MVFPSRFPSKAMGVAGRMDFSVNYKGQDNAQNS